MRTRNRDMLVYGLILVFLLSIVSPGLAAPTTGQTESVSKIISAFKDVTDKDSNLAFINYLSSRGIIKGFPDGTFHPTEGLTRAQAAAIVVLAGGVKADPALASPFRDVPANHWSRTNIAAAVKAGYISGFPDKSFHPEEKISRAQAVSLILRLSKQPLSGAVLPQLSDLNSGHWAAPAVAVGIASGMLGLSADKTQVYPEQAMSRGDLARALGVLLTKDPDLSQAALVGKLNVKSGTVTVQSGSQEAKTVSGSSVIAAGDTITTDKNAEADITYGDGSGLLLKGDSQLIVKEARGRSYIKADGSSGIAVDWLLVDMKKGQLFGALATSSQESSNSTGSTEKKTTSYLDGGKKLLASLNANGLMAAANDEAQVWYETSKTKKVKVKVDMPWGVAAIRGTFWNNMVNANGTGSTSLLTGSGEVTAGGQTVSLSAMQATQVTAAGAAPVAAQTMTSTQMSVWTQAAGWAEQRAAAIQQSQEASPQAPAVNVQTQTTQPTVVQSIVQTISNAISTVQNTVSSTPAASPASNSSGSSSSSSGNSSSSNSGNSGNTGSATAPLGANLGSYTLTDRVSVTGTVYGQSDSVLTQDFSLSNLSADLLARATHYELWAKLGEYDYVQIGQPTPIGQPIRHLKKVFSQADRLRVTFHNSNKYEPVGLAALSSGSLNNQATRTISGTISLPDGTSAPAGGIKIDVCAEGPSYFSGYANIRQEITIPAGSNSAAYALKVPANTDSNQGFYLVYKLNGTYTQKYIMSGSYADMVDVSSADQTNRNMTIQLGRVISGTVSMPGSTAATTELKLNVSVEPALSGRSMYRYHPYSTGIAIPNGQSSAQYSLVVPTSEDYKLYYELYVVGNADPNDYLVSNSLLRKGYYQGGDVMAGAADINNMNMVLLNGSKISGTLSLANSRTAPAGDLNVHVYAYATSGSNYYSWTNVRIPAGHNSVPYVLMVESGTYNVGAGNYSITNINGVNAGAEAINLEINPFPNVASTTLAPVAAANRSVLVGNTIFGLDCPQFIEELVLPSLHNSGTALYYKSEDGQWFDLQNALATSGSYISSSNAISDPAATVPPIYYGNTAVGGGVIAPQIVTSSATTTYYVGPGSGSAVSGNFTMTPADTTLEIVGNTAPTIATLSLQPLSGGNWQSMIIPGETPGTTKVTIRATCIGYSNLESEITINVLPGLSCSPASVSRPYSAELITLTGSSGLWAVGDMLGIQIININTKDIYNPGSISNTGNTVSFSLPMDLPVGQYVLYVMKAGSYVAVGKIIIVQAT